MLGKVLVTAQAKVRVPETALEKAQAPVMARVRVTALAPEKARAPLAVLPERVRVRVREPERAKGKALARERALSVAEAPPRRRCRCRCCRRRCRRRRRRVRSTWARSTERSSSAWHVLPVEPLGLFSSLSPSARAESLAWRRLQWVRIELDEDGSRHVAVQLE
ncbi:hypothetical protein [Roseateles chitinivorans]|uniref:hypothetical protein n=1 Tax=Roseateles chitinivorans TaxID=2917965 RepID=UPI003D6736D3